MSFAGITSGIMAICASVFFLTASISIAYLARYLIKKLKYKDDEEWPSVGS